MQRTDEEIKKSVVDQLYWDDRVDASDIKVEVSSGKVTLTGTAPRPLARRAAETDAMVVPGVASVHNLIEVNYPGAAKRVRDSEIGINIETLLLAHSSIDGSEINVSVDAGVVTLSGSVDTYWKKLVAEDIAEIKGVVGIVNKLVVVPSQDIMDEVIAKGVVNAIERNSNVDVDSVTVKVDKGKVTLAGTLPNWVAYRFAQQATTLTAGVTDVDTTNLIVKPQG